MSFEKLSPLEFEEINIVPMHDCIQHTDGMDCVCCPTWDARNQWNLIDKTEYKMIVVHRRVIGELQ